MSYQVHNSRRILPHGASRKRKEREERGFKQPSAPTVKPAPSRSTTQPALSSNRLLAGYMAYEFITRGTLLGRECNSAVPRVAEPNRAMKPIEAGADEPMNEEDKKGGDAAQDSYVEVASILTTEGAHIPGIVNPTQLARWIQM